MKHIVLILLLAAMPLSAAAEEIFMCNGDRISGRVTAITDAGVQLEAEYGKMELSRNDILKIVFNRDGGRELTGDVTVEDILLFIKNSPLRFYKDGKAISGESLSNQIRVRQMMTEPTLKDVRKFTQNYLTRSESGKLLEVRNQGKKKINLVDWLDAKIARLSLKTMPADSTERVYHLKRVPDSPARTL